MSTGCAGVIVKRVGSKIELLVTQTDVIVEHGHLRVCMVLTPVSGEHGRTVHQLTSFKEVTEVIHAVVVERVTIERRLTMLQDHIIASLCQLRITVIISIVAGKTQRIALRHLDMTKSLKAIGLLIEMSAITIEVGSCMTEMNIAMQYLCIVIAVLVVVEIIRMNQIYTFVLHLLTGGSTLSWCSCKNYCQQQNGQKEYQEPLQSLIF